jgi:hypothetical protein
MPRHDGWFAVRLAERLAESLHVQEERADRPEDLYWVQKVFDRGERLMQISCMPMHDGWFAVRLAERLAESLHVQEERADRPEDLLGAIGLR